MMKFWMTYTAVLLIGMSSLAAFLVLYKQKSFSPEKLDRIINSSSSLKAKTDDPCKYLTPGDPIRPDKLAIKIQIHCGEKTALNTFSWTSVDEKTVRGVIDYTSRVNGIVSDIGEWKCEINGAEVIDYDTVVRPDGLINCKVY